MDGVTVYPLRVYYCFCDVSRESSADVLSVGCVSMRIARCCSIGGEKTVKKLLTCVKDDRHEEEEEAAQARQEREAPENSCDAQSFPAAQTERWVCSRGSLNNLQQIFSSSLSGNDQWHNKHSGRSCEFFLTPRPSYFLPSAPALVSRFLSASYFPR